MLPPSTTSGRVRPRPSMWVLVGMCALVAGLGSSLGSVLGFMATTLRADLGLTRGGVGVLVSVFFGTTGVAAFTAGTLADRVGATRAMTAQMVLLALGCVGAAAVGSYPALLVACAVGGFAYALGVVGTNLAIVSEVAVTDQARALSLRTVGVAVFSMPCSLLAPAVAERVGWRPILVAIAVAALASVPLVRRIMSDAPAVPTSGPTTATADPDGVAQRPPLPAGFFWFPVGAFFFVAGVQAQLSWVVPYLSESVGLEEGVAGVVVTVATGTGILGALVLLRRGDPDASRRLVKVVGLCASAAGFTVLIALGDVLGPTSVALGLAASTAVSLAAVGAMQAAVVAAAADAVGRSTGVTLTGYFLGSLVAPTAFGLLVDAVGGYGWAWIATALSYAFAAVAFQQARRIPVHPVGPAIAA